MLTVITGLPASGKSTFVRHHANRGDIVIDFDLIATAMTVNTTGEHDYPTHVRACAAAAWRPAVDQAIKLSPRHTVWIIHAAPSPAQQRWYRARGATIRTIKADEHTRQARLGQRQPN